MICSGPAELTKVFVETGLDTRLLLTVPQSCTVDALQGALPVIFYLKIWSLQYQAMSKERNAGEQRSSASAKCVQMNASPAWILESEL